MIDTCKVNVSSLTQGIKTIKSKLNSLSTKSATINTFITKTPKEAVSNVELTMTKY